MGPRQHWRFERGAIRGRTGNLRATCPSNRRFRAHAVCSGVDSAMVRRARLQNARAEEFGDRGPGKLMCIEGGESRGSLCCSRAVRRASRPSALAICGTGAATYRSEVVSQLWTSETSC